jgi:hypothetical protein
VPDRPTTPRENGDAIRHFFKQIYPFFIVVGKKLFASIQEGNVSLFAFAV